MTPAELNLYAAAHTERRREEQRLAQANLYSLAALVRAMIWAKHPPSFDRVFPEERREKMSDEQMYAMVKGLNAFFGGEEAE